MKKTRKRIVSFLLAFCLALALPFGASAEQAVIPDIACPGDGAPWYSQAVYYLWNCGIVNGDSGSRFFPQRDVTREEFVTLLGRTAEKAGKDLQAPDLAAGVSDYARPYFSWAVSNGIIKGDNSGLAPRRTVTRQEMAVILLRFAHYMGLPTTGVEDQRDFNQLCDRDEISPWAKEDVQVAYLTGLINGIEVFFCSKDPVTGIYADGYLHYMKPKMSVTRAQAAQAVYNYVKLAGLEEQIAGTPSSGPSFDR